MLQLSIRKRDVLKPWFVFRSAVTGRYVSRWWALTHPATTVKEKRWR